MYNFILFLFLLFLLLLLLLFFLHFLFKTYDVNAIHDNRPYFLNALSQLKRNTCIKKPTESTVIQYLPVVRVQ